MTLEIPPNQKSVPSSLWELTVSRESTPRLDRLGRHCQAACKQEGANATQKKDSERFSEKTNRRPDPHTRFQLPKSNVIGSFSPQKAKTPSLHILKNSRVTPAGRICSADNSSCGSEKGQHARLSPPLPSASCIHPRVLKFHPQLEELQPRRLDR